MKKRKKVKFQEENEIHNKLSFMQNKNHINMCFVGSNKFYYKCMVSLLIYLIGDFIYSMLSYVTGDFIYIFICLFTIVLGMGVLH